MQLTWVHPTTAGNLERPTEVPWFYLGSLHLLLNWEKMLLVSPSITLKKKKPN